MLWPHGVARLQITRQVSPASHDVFSITGPFRSCERKFHGARGPGSEWARERKAPGAKVPGSELARVLLADLLRVANSNWPGSKKAVNRFLDLTLRSWAGRIQHSCRLLDNDCVDMRTQKH